MPGLAVPNPRTWTVGDLDSAGLLNANIRDGLNFLLNPPLWQGYQNAAQSCTTGTVTSITWDTNVVDTYGGHSVSTNPSRYVAQVAGWYRVYSSVEWAANAAGQRVHLLAVNGSILSGARSDMPGLSVPITTSIQFEVFLNANDYIETQVQQTSGSTLATGGARSSMQVRWEHT